MWGYCTYTNLFGDLNDVIKGLEVGVDNDGWVNVLIKEALDGGEDLTGEDDDGGSSITDLFVLGTGKLDHTLGGWMLHINFSEDGVTVVGEDDTSHWVQQHLKHALWSEGCSNNIGDSSGGLNVSSLSFLTLLSLGIWVQNVDWCLTHVNFLL